MNAVATQAQVKSFDPKKALELIQGKTVILQLAIGGIGSRAAVSNADMDVEASRERLKMSKGIMQSPWLSVVNSFAQRTQSRLRDLSLPSMLKNGLYQLPITMIAEVDSYLTEQRANWEQRVGEFMKDYRDDGPEGLKARDRAALQIRVGENDVDLFREDDYPSPSAVRACFKWEHRYFTFSTPPSLEEIGAELYQREIEKAEALARKQMDEVNELLCLQMKTLVDHVHERLSADPITGKKKIIRETLTEKIDDFLAHFDSRNVFGNEELSVLAKQAREALAGTDGTTLHDMPHHRLRVVTAFEEIKSKLAGMIEEAPDRAIDLEG